MSGSIRDLVVGIEFDSVDLSELLRTESALDEIESQLQSMGISIDDASQELNHMGSTANDTFHLMAQQSEQTHSAMATHFNNSAALGGKMWAGIGRAALAAVPYITGAISAAYGAIVATVMDTEQAFDRLEAKTGATGAELEGLKNVASDVFRNGFGQDLNQVTDDVSTMRSMFKGLNDEELAGLTKNAYAISDLWGPEVKEVAKTAKTMTATFKGLTNANALDLMTVAFQQTGDYSDDLLDTFNEYSVYFQKLGFDAKGFTNVLIKGAKAGAFTMDKSADAIKEFGIRSIDASDSTADGFKAIGLNAKKMTKEFAAGGDKAQNAFAATMAGLAAMKNPVKQNAAGVALFGTQWEDLRETVVLAMTDGKDAVGQFKGATQEAAIAAQDNFGTRMTKVMRDLKLKIADAFKENGGKELLDALASKAEGLVPKIENMVGKAIDFANAVKDNWPAIRETTIGITTAVGSFVAIMGALKIISVVNALMVAFRTGTVLATLAQLGLNVAMLANPMTWVVIGISALIAAGVALYRNWDTVATKMDSIWNSIRTGAAKAVNAIIGELNAFIKMINKIPGVNIPIVPKVYWGKDNTRHKGGGIDNEGTVTGAYLASHATGLERVPYDNYPANLHRDEAILTAKQSNALRAAGILSKAGNKPKLNMNADVAPTRKKQGGTTVFSPNVNITVNGASGDAKEIAKQAALAAKKELEKLFTQLGMAFE